MGDSYMFAASRKENVEEMFEVGRELGRGATSIVKLVTRRSNPSEKYAMKMMKKDKEKDVIRTEIR